MRIGILSFAHLHAEAYIQNLRAVPDVELIGIADEDLDRGKRFSEMFNARLFPSYQALLDEKPDGVIICSENANHKELVEMAAKAGAQVLSEKPLAVSLEDAQQMIDVCRQEKVFLMTAYPMRFNAPLIEIKSMLEQNKLGRIFLANGQNQGQVPSHHRDWFVDKKLAGGGAVMDHTVHLSDIFRWYLHSEVVEVYAQTNRIIQKKLVHVETAGLVMLKFENGTFATIDCSWSRPLHYPTWGGLALEIVGEYGVATANAFGQNITIFGQENKPTDWVNYGSDANQAMINEFAASIREKRQPIVTGYDGYKSLEIALATYQSAASGQPVKLPIQ